MVFPLILRTFIMDGVEEILVGDGISQAAVERADFIAGLFPDLKKIGQRRGSFRTHRQHTQSETVQE